MFYKISGFFSFLNYESTIIYLQETWNILNKVIVPLDITVGFRGKGKSVKGMPAMQETACSTPGFDPWSGKIWRRQGNPLQYSCLGNPVDRGAWRETVYGVAKVRHDLMTKSPPYIAIIF